MPRIDPLQLLNCLKVLLSKDGGILSKEEVSRLANLMTKFSKKLVSKCVYVLILKNTETSLLNSFMSAGGWTLIFNWLQDGTNSKNWPLVQELLDLLLLVPVDVPRLKSNNMPKLVKSISKREDLGGIYQLANQLVEQWLTIVKSETIIQKDQQQHDIVVQPTTIIVQNTNTTAGQIVNASVVENAEQQQLTAIPAKIFYKISPNKEGKIIAKFSSQTENNLVAKTEETPVVNNDSADAVDAAVKSEDSFEETAEAKKVDDRKSKEKSNHDRSKHKSSSSSSRSKERSSSSSSSSSSRDKSSSSSSSIRDKERSHSSSSKSRDKDRDRSRDKDRDKDRDKSRSNGSHKSSSSKISSSSSKENKEKQAEKDKQTLLKIQQQQQPNLNKLGRIPKKSSSSNSADDAAKKKSEDGKKPNESGTPPSKKSSISIEVRNKNEDRPKTVKVFNAKMRSTGLEEAPTKPPPPRGSNKKPSSSALNSMPSIPTKRPSPVRENVPPPEKRTKITETEDKPGAIKLIPAKPKPNILLESDLFMDTLTASAATRKEPKKRKRRLSSSKDSGPSSPPVSPSVNNASNSPLALKNISAPKFYQETLETESNSYDQNKSKNDDSVEINDRETTPTDVEEIGPSGPDENVVKETDGLKGVLVYLKKRGPKKSLKWKNDSDLVEIKYFELDETERVNVTKTFSDMKQFDISAERQVMMQHRKLNVDDVMDERTAWKHPILVDCPPYPVEPGSKSLEKDIQFAREKTVLQALCFNKAMLPDFPGEPDPEVHPMTDPVQIPLDDDNVELTHDLTNIPWPEPKGSPPEQSSVPQMPQMFPGIPGNPFVQAVPNIGGPPPGGFPPFVPPGGFPPNMMGPGPGVEWNNMNGMPPNMPPDMGGPPIFGGPPPDGFNNMMNDNVNNFGPPPQGFQGPPGMFHNNFRGNNRGNFRPRGPNGPWFRGPPPQGGGWRPPPPPRGGGGNNWMGRGVCKNVTNYGSCRHRDTCPFMHPPPNNVGRNN